MTLVASVMVVVASASVPVGVAVVVVLMVLADDSGGMDRKVVGDGRGADGSVLGPMLYPHVFCGSGDGVVGVGVVRVGMVTGR